MASQHPGLLRCSVRGGAVAAHWLGPREHPWLRELIELYETFAGRPRRLLDESLLELRRGGRAGTGLSVAMHVLDRAFRSEAVAAVPAPRARAVLFRAAARREERGSVLARAAAELGVSAAALEDALLADVPGERRVRAPERAIAAADVASLCNLAIAQAALKCSSEVAVSLEGHARAVVRHAVLRGLICTVSRPAPDAPIVLGISGPLALFRRTTLYGRQLAELVPVLAWSRRFELRARCLVRGAEGSFVLRSGDPVPAGPEPRLYDSALERRFARDFVRVAPDWELVREPEPVEAEGALVFPDFGLRHRRDPARRWLLEIAGFWTQDYLEHKLRRLRAAGVQRLVLCVDAARDCGDGALPASARVLRFRRHIDARAVLALIEAE